MRLFFQIAHNRLMELSDFVTDMAADSLERHALESLADTKELQCGIVRRFVRLADADLARKIGRAQGVYVTYDCPPAALESERGVRSLQNYIANAAMEMAGIMGRKSRVLVVGLGNGEVTADALGGAVADLMDVSPVREAERRGEKSKLCAFKTGVEGRTGIKSADAVEGLCAKLRPSCVIAVDSLATSSVRRLGTSFQITTAGIAPGSGAGGDRARIDRSSLGVPVIAIGVPLVLSMRTVLSDFVHDYEAAAGCGGSEYKLRELMAEKRLGGLVVAPKEIGWYVESAAAVIAGAINTAFGEHGGKSRLKVFK